MMYSHIPSKGSIGRSEFKSHQLGISMQFIVIIEIIPVRAMPLLDYLGNRCLISHVPADQIIDTVHTFISFTRAKNDWIARLAFLVKHLLGAGIQDSIIIKKIIL